MEIRSYFHDPDISLPIIRRRVAEVFIDLLACYGKLVTRGALSLTGSTSFPSKEAYYNAMRRLRKAGLIAYTSRPDNEPVLQLTEAGKAQTSQIFKPERFWKKKWNGIWYVLVYDVPEEQRRYRDALRGFLQRMRMGCLQRSVWVSPRDVRPEYDDLVKTVKIQFVSFLFEAATVLGRNAQDIVLSAWDFDRLDQIHGWYCEVYQHNLYRIGSNSITRETLQAMAEEEISAYLSAMQEDPLLPHELLPAGYRGFKVFELHKTFVQEVKTLMRKRFR